VPDEIPAAIPLIAYVAGLALGGGTREIAGLAIVALLVAILRRRVVAIAMLFLTLGVAVHARAAYPRACDERALAAIDAERFVAIEATIDREWSRRGDSFVIRVPQFRMNGRDFDRPLAIYVRFEPAPIAMEKTIVAEGLLRRGDRGDLSLTVKSPRLLSYRGSIASLAPATWNRVMAHRVEPLAAIDSDDVALIEALALGRGERLTDSVRASFRRGGTYHLLVFSGLQIAFAAAAIALLLRWLHAPRASDWLLLTFSIVAPLFIGPTASVSRASFGIGVYAVSRILKRPTTIENLWCVAALARLIAVPSDLNDASFQLTYAGAGAILFIGKPLARGRLKWAAYAIATELAVLPLTLFFFHQYALGGSILTFVLTPLVSAMMALSFAVCLVPSAKLLLCVHAMHVVCDFMNAIGAHASGFFAAPPVVALVIGFGLAMLMLRRPKLIVVALLIPSAAAIARDRLAHRVDAPHMIVLDVGQGDSILLRDGSHNVLIDGGGRTDDWRFGESTLLPMLVDRGVRHVDLVILTHVHPDHCGGLPAVVERLGAGALWITPRRFRGDCATTLLASASETETPILLARDGDRRSIGALRLTALPADRTFKRAAENNASLAMQLQVGARRILLLGDVEREEESELVDRRGGSLRSDVLKVAHHGSRSSTTETLLDGVQPRIAVISCGRHNPFGHPHPSVIEALARRDVRLYRTDRNGAIDLAFERGRIDVSREIDTPR